MNRIDIIVSMYNKENDIEKCITSIVNQSLLPNKIIIVNNNSTDNSTDVVEKIINENKIIPIEIINEKKQGAQYARYAGAEYSSSEFITFLDGDDYMCSNHIEVINALINDYSNFDVFCSSYIYESNNQIRDSRNTNDLIISNNKSHFFKNYFYNRGMLCSSNITCKKSIITNEWIESNDRIGEDLNIWFNIISKTNFVCVNKNTIVINKTPKSPNSSKDQKRLVRTIINKNRINVEESNTFFERMVYTRRIIYVDIIIGVKSLLKRIDLLLVMILLETFRIIKLRMK